LKKIIFFSIFYISCYGYTNEAGQPRENNVNLTAAFQNAYTSTYSDTQIDSSFKDVVDLMNSVVYTQYKNKVRYAKAEKIVKNQANQLRYSADSIDFNQTGKNFIDSKNKLSETGIDLNFMYTGDAVLDYGLKYMGNFDFKISFDFEKSLNLVGLKSFVYILGDHGDKLQDLTGVSQGISNIEAASTWKLYEFWLEQSLFNDKLSLLFGLHDLNTEFDCREASSIFLNPSQAIGPDFSQSGRNGPSIFPTTSLSFRIKYNFLQNFTLLSAAFDGVPGDPENPYGTHIILNKNDGLLITNEINYAAESGSRGGSFRLGAGSWLFTSKFEDLLDLDITGKNVKREGNLGFYFFGENKIIMNESFPANEISFYLRTGTANQDVNQFNSYYGGGISFKGLWGRKDDIFGLAFGLAHNSYKYRKLLSGTDMYPGVVQPFEVVWEATYNFQLNSFISLQPDVQYILNPSQNYIHDNILLSLIRIKFSY